MIAVGLFSLSIRPASVDDISSIVEIRLDALTEEEVAGSAISGDSLYLSVEKLHEVWDKENKFIGSFEVFVAEHEGRVVGSIVVNMNNFDDNTTSL